MTQLSPPKQSILDNIIADLANLRNVQAVVLGGSHATGRATLDSDLDIGIYYYEASPFSIEDIRAVALKYSIEQSAVVTGFYEWGPWVNGGAWINSKVGKIDFLYKNIDQVKSTIDKAHQGIWEKHFEQQPPYGFSSLIMLGETAIALPLYDPTSILVGLKGMVRNYPSQLKEAVIQQSLWSAEFSIWHADIFLKSLDVYNIVGCLTRAVKNIVDVLFAANEIYPLGDKRAIEVLTGAKTLPPEFIVKIEAILLMDKNNMGKSIDLLKALFAETVEISPVKYKPFYSLKSP